MQKKRTDCDNVIKSLMEIKTEDQNLKKLIYGIILKIKDYRNNDGYRITMLHNIIANADKACLPEIYPPPRTVKTYIE